MVQFQIMLLGLFVPLECMRGTSFLGVGRGGLEAGRNKFFFFFRKKQILYGNY